jgi:hypothetical protein
VQSRNFAPAFGARGQHLVRRTIAASSRNGYCTVQQTERPARISVVSTCDIALLASTLVRGGIVGFFPRAAARGDGNEPAGSSRSRSITMAILQSRILGLFRKAPA